MLRVSVHRVGNHGRLPEKPCRQRGGRSNRPEHSVYSPLPFYSHHSRSIPFFSGNILGVGRTVREINFPDLVPRLEKVKEDRLIHPVLAEFEVVPMNRRFRTVVLRYVVPAVAGHQDIQDTVDQPAGVTPGSADVRLRWREVFPDNLTEITVNFPEGRTPGYYLRGLINLGRPHSKIVRKLLSLISPIWPHDPTVLRQSERYSPVNSRGGIQPLKLSSKSKNDANLRFLGGAFHLMSSRCAAETPVLPGTQSTLHRAAGQCR